ncbi:MAG: replication factor A, partial [Bradymonadaceae bacterium]
MGGLDEIGGERGALEIGGADHLLDESGDCLDRDPDQFGDAPGVDRVEETVEFTPETTPIGSVEIGQTVDI